MRVERSINIAAPPEKIWPFLIEPEKVLQWCVTFRKFEYSGKQRSGAGTAIYIEEKAGGPMPLMKLNFVITEWMENERIAFTMTSGNLAEDYQQWWTIATIPTGSQFTFVENFKMPFGFFGQLIGLAAQNMSKATAGKMLALLKKLAEAPAD